MEQARLELEKEKRSAIAAIRSQAADLVVAAASKVLARTLTSEDQEHLLQDALAGEWRGYSERQKSCPALCGGPLYAAQKWGRKKRWEKSWPL